MPLTPEDRQLIRDCRKEWRRLRDRAQALEREAKNVRRQMKTLTLKSLAEKFESRIRTIHKYAEDPDS